MSDDDQERPATDKPLHGPRRRTAGPLVLTAVAILVILGIFVLYTWLRY